MERVVGYEPRGAILDLFNAREPEILVCGPSGTGKTYGICQLIHLLCLNHPGVRILMCRKTLTALTSTMLVTFREKVLTLEDPVRFHGGSQQEPASFRYANGSRIVVGGLDNPEKILSSEYDLVAINEATEVSEEDIEILTTRLRNGVLRFPRLVMDCNPSHEKHYLLQRCRRGQTRLINSHHADNPSITDDYIETLRRLSGSRYERFYEGKWTGVANAIYDNFDRFKHLGPVATGLLWVDGAIGVDYGDVHPHALCAVSRASTGRLVVRETWSGRSYDDLVDTVGRFRQQYQITRVRVDPMLKGWERTENSPIRGRVNRADSSPGSRKNRIEYVYRLFGDNALTLDINGAGNAELADEIEMYHYVHRQTETQDDLVVARINEDRVAAFEYAIEELEAVNRIDLPRAVVRQVNRSQWQPHEVSA